MRRTALLALLPIGLTVGGSPPSLRPFAQTAAPRIQEVRLLHGPRAPVLRIASAERDALLARRLGEMATAFDPTQMFPDSGSHVCDFS